MNSLKLFVRRSTLEGGNGILFVVSAIVLAVLFGLSAATLCIALDTRRELRSEVSGLRSDVLALPDQINQGLLELNRALAGSITAVRTGPQAQPIIIEVSPTSSKS